MKKLIASLALLGLATLTFGQSLVLSGYIDTGVTALANGVDKAVLGLWGDDAAVNGGRVKLIGKYDNGDFGASFETRWDGLLSNIDTSKYSNVGAASSLFPTAAIPVYFKHAYAQAQFFDKMVLTQVGILKEESTKTGGKKNFKFATETPGAAVVVKPIADLAIQAAFLPAIGTSTTTTEAVANLVDTQTGLSAAYTLKGIARVSAGVLYFQSAKNGYVPSKAYAGTNLYLVPNLTATVEGQIESLNTGKADSVTGIVETLSYNLKDAGLPAWTAGLISYQYLYGDDTKTNSSKEHQDLSYRIEPSVAYALDGGITLGLGGAYQAGAAVSTLKTNSYSYDLGYGVGLATATKGNLNKIATIDVRPSVKLTLTKAQFLTLLYAYTQSVGSDDVVFVTTNKDAKSMHTFQANYTYTF